MRHHPINPGEESWKTLNDRPQTEGAHPEQRVRISRRGCLYGLALSTLALGAGGIAVLEHIAQEHVSQCGNCDASPGAAAATNEGQKPPGGIPLEIVDHVQLANGSLAPMIAAPHSKKDQVATVDVGSVIVIAVGQNTFQNGRLDGDESILTSLVSEDSTQSYNYAARGYSGQILAVTIDALQRIDGTACNEPVYCIEPPADGSQPVYHAYLYPPHAYDRSLLQAMAQDPSLNLGANPLTTELQASGIAY